jgi:hypothetical protein
MSDQRPRHGFDEWFPAPGSGRVQPVEPRPVLGMTALPDDPYDCQTPTAAIGQASA